jgi:hypothetical protein
MRPQRVFRPHELAILAVAAIAVPLGASAGELPENRPSAPRAVDEVDRLVVPQTFGEADLDLPTLQVRALSPTAVPGVAGLHRADVFTDANAGLPLPEANAIERVKLEMARAAIEASRAAGTLEMQLPDDTLPATLEELQAMKEQALAAKVSAPLPADPIAGVGEELPSVQEIGAPGLTPYEEAKLRGESPEPAQATSSPESTTGRGDGAPVAKHEVDRHE